jgi:hypothetical protein
VSCSKAHPTPLLFVHGACHAAWCWDEHFLDFFADNGFQVIADGHNQQGSGRTERPAVAQSNRNVPRFLIEDG